MISSQEQYLEEMRIKILKIRFGVNPNSSSIGSDLGWLLMGAAAVTFAVNFLDAGIRLWLKRRRIKDGSEG